jgi:hypothetical protein
MFKNMKTIVMLLMMLATTSVIFAQRGHGRWHGDPQAMANRQTDKMKSALSLDERQYAAVKNINTFYATKLMTMRKDSTTARESKRTEMQNLRTQKEKEIAAVLSPDQQTKWKNIQSEMKAKHDTLGRHDYGKHHQEMKTALSLSDDQQKRMDDVNKSFRDKFHAVKADSTLSKDDARKKIAEIKNAQDSEVKNILSPDQYAKWKTYESDKRSKRDHGHHHGDKER